VRHGTNGVPPALELIHSAAITPTHHILVNGVWCQAKGTGVAAARPLTAKVTSILQVLDGEIVTRYHFPLGYSYSLAMCQQGNFQLDNGMWAASLRYKMQPEPSSLPQESPLSSSSIARWVPTYSEASSKALKELAGPGLGIVRWQAGGVIQGPLGNLTITGSLQMPDVDTTNRSPNPDLWIHIFQVMLPEKMGLMMLQKSALVNRAWKKNVGVLLDPGSKWQKRRAAAMEVGDAQLKTLLRQHSPEEGANGTHYRRTCSVKDLSSMWLFMRAFSSEPTLEETAAKVLIAVLDTSTLTDTDADVIIQGHALTFVECRYMLYNSLVTALVRHAFLHTP